MFKNILKSFETLLFPPVCLVCKKRLLDREPYVCSRCLETRYPDPNSERNKTCEGILLPNSVYFQDALWKFEKGGSLQDLLHALKYKGLGSLGIRLGTQLGKRMKTNPGYEIWKEENESVLVVGVPLHPKKLKIRGYNQAEKIAIGVAKQLDISILPNEALIRTKHTATQTHFSHIERIKNMDEAFMVPDNRLIKDKCILIVDDVFTTGSTTFAIAEVLKKAGAKQIGIITLALA